MEQGRGLHFSPFIFRQLFVFVDGEDLKRKLPKGTGF